MTTYLDELIGYEDTLQQLAIIHEDKGHEHLAELARDILRETGMRIKAEQDREANEAAIAADRDNDRIDWKRQQQRHLADVTRLEWGQKEADRMDAIRAARARGVALGSGE